jgi:hypothetical protein
MHLRKLHHKSSSLSSKKIQGWGNDCTCLFNFWSPFFIIKVVKSPCEVFLPYRKERKASEGCMIHGLSRETVRKIGRNSLMGPGHHCGGLQHPTSPAVCSPHPQEGALLLGVERGENHNSHDMIATTLLPRPHHFILEGPELGRASSACTVIAKWKHLCNCKRFFGKVKNRKLQTSLIKRGPWLPT